MRLCELAHAVALNWDAFSVELGTLTVLSHDSDIAPEDFLAFAKRDIEGEDTQSFVNALSNAKRAIDCQVDRVLSCLGLDARRQYLPAKLATLRELNVVAPQIIKRVITARNYLEHEYKCPDPVLVRDAIDIASLFVGATNEPLRLFQEEFWLGNDEDMLGGDASLHHCLYFKFDTRSARFTARGYKDGALVGVVGVDPKSIEHGALVRAAIALSHGGDADEEVQQSLDLMV